MEQPSVNNMEDWLLKAKQQGLHLIDRFSEILVDCTNELDSSLRRTCADKIRLQRDNVAQMKLYSAIEGALKAGKSSSVCAAVGEDICPQRNTACTTVPIVLQHCPGKSVPMLMLPKPEPLVAAVKSIKSVKKISQGVKTLTDDPAMEDVLSQLERGDLDPEVLTGVHEGAEVKRIITLMNDLIRICNLPTFSLPNPLEEFRSVADLPVVSVEFASLKGKETPGVFCMVDTPGPNERGMNGLNHVLNTVLKDTLVTIPVLSYKDLNAHHVEDVQKAVKKTQRKKKTKLFVLINQYDEHMENHPSEEETKDLVRRELFPDVDYEEMFCVSAKNACLANQARKLIAILKEDPSAKVPQLNEYPWLKDFLKVGCGTTWERGFKRESAKKLEEFLGWLEDIYQSVWESSNFQQPIENVVTRCFLEAAPLSLNRAMAETDRCASKVEEKLRLRLEGLNVNLAALKEQLEETKKLCERVSESMELVKKSVECHVADFMQAFKKDIVSTTRNIIDALNSCHNDHVSWWRYYLKHSEPPKDEIAVRFGKLMSENSLLQFFTQKECHEALSDSLDVVGKLVIGEMQECARMQTPRMNQTVRAVNSSVSSMIEVQLKEHSNTIRQKLNVSPNFSEFTLEEPPMDDLNEMQSLVQASSVETTRERTRYERRFYTLFLYPHAVVETIKERKHCWSIDPNQFRKKAIKRAKASADLVTSTMEEYIRCSFNKTLEDYHANIRDALEQLKQNFHKSIDDHMKDQESKKELTLKLNSSLEEISKLKKDIAKVQKRLAQRTSILSANKDL